MHFSVGDHELTSRTNRLPKWFKYPLADEEFTLYLPATHLACWHLLCCDRCVRSPGGTYLNKLERRLQMTSWHETCPRWQVWQAAKLQVGGGVLGQATSRWSNMLWKILEILASHCLCLSVILPIISAIFSPMRKSCEIPASGSFLCDLSWGAPAEFQHVKWSRET